MISRRSMKAGVVVETIIILVGVGLIAKAAMLGMSTYRFIHMASVTDGTVTGVSNYGFTLSVQVNSGAGGFVFLQNTLPLGTQIGEHVEVYYDPANPQRAMMQKFISLWFDTAWRGLLGLLLAAFGFHLRNERSI